MKFEEAHNLLPQYEAGELNPPQREALEAALANSPELRAELDAWRALRAATNRMLRTETLPAGLRARVVASLTPAAAPSPRTLRLWPVLAPLSAAAAIALAVWMGWPATTDAPDPTPIVQAPPATNDQPAESNPQPQIVSVAHVSATPFATIYSHCAEKSRHRMNNVPTGSCKAAVDAIAQHANFGGAALIPDFSASGFELDGVCTCCPFQVDGLHVVHAYYRAADDRVVSVFSLDKRVTLDAAQTMRGAKRQYQVARVEQAGAAVDGVCVVAWQDESRVETFATCGRLPESELQQLAERATFVLAPISSPFAFAAHPAPLIGFAQR